jgi:xylan 1,4-beta-xylosidase
VVQFTSNLAAEGSPLGHFWEHTVGSGHAPLALRADWQRQLARCRRELGFRHVRFHGILSDPMGTLTCQQERLLYSFFNGDSIVDFLLSIGMRPFVELSFMPTTLASGTQTVFRYQGNVTPPRDYRAWAALIEKLVRHWVDRYGVAEVREWYFEVWNEPNLHAFWTGTQADYFELYRHTAEAIKGIDPALRVGGPASAKNAWITEFLDFCAGHGIAADFVSTHHYPTDAFGAPGDDTITQLAKSHRGAMREETKGARERARGRPLYYTEWNTSSNSRDLLHDQPYAAAVVVKTMLEANGLVQGYSFWAFTDVFAENYYASVPFHGGFGLLNLQGIPKPTYSAYLVLHGLGTELLPVEGSHATVDCWVVKGERETTVVLTNHALPRHPIAREVVQIELAGVSAEPRSVTIVRIDEDHANPYRAWTGMGSPEYLSAAAVSALEADAVLSRSPFPATLEGGSLRLEVALPPHAVAAIALER